MNPSHGLPVASPMFEMHNSTDSYKKTDEEEITLDEQICQEIRKSIIFDAIAVHFRILVFLKQLLSHTVIPLFPILSPNCWNGHSVLSIVYNFVFPILVYIMILSCFMCSENDMNIIDGALWMPLIFFLQHRCCIALKYATLSETEYARFMRCRNVHQTQIYQKQMQLFSGWMSLDDNVLHYELSVASARIGANISNMYIIINNPDNAFCKSYKSQFDYWNAYVRGHKILELSTKPSKEFIRQSNGNYVLSVYDLTLAIIRRANTSEFYGNNNFIAYCIVYTFTTLNAMIPFIKLFNQRDTLHVDSVFWLVSFFFSSTIINAIFGAIVFFLLHVAIVDVLRQYTMVCQMHCMLRLTDLMMHLELSLGVRRASEKAMDSARCRLDAIISITQSNTLHQKRACKNGTGFYEDKVKANSDNKHAYMAAHTNFDDVNVDVDLEEGDEGEENSHNRRCSIIGEQIAADTAFAITPRISFHHSQNIIGWTYARLIIQNFGERFRFRLDSYVACTLLLLVVLVIFEIQLVVQADLHSSAFESTYFIQSFLAVTMGVLFLILLSSIGSLVNNELLLQSRTLASHSIKFQYRVRKARLDSDTSETSETEIEKLKEITEAIDAAMDIIEVNTELRPFKILGMTASPALTMSIITASLSFYSVMASFYFGSGSEAVDVLSNV